MITKKSFRNVANLVKKHRLFQSISQNDLAVALGYKNAQFVSNVERGMCSIPLQQIDAVIKLLGINPFEMRKALIYDFEETIDGLIDYKKAQTNSDVSQII